MTEIEKKALALVDDVRDERGDHPLLECFSRKYDEIEALCRAIEQHEADKAAHAATVEGILNSHEAYKREVSDALIEEFGGSYSMVPSYMHRFIIPEPSADPLVEVFMEAQHLDADAALCLTLHTREALAKRGLKIVEISQ